MSFENKVVIITGAAGGIGSAAAIHFAKLKAKLALVDVNEQLLEETLQKCRLESKNKENSIAIAVNLRNVDEVKDVVTKTVEKFGQIDVLVNNAAISSKDNILTENFLDNYNLTFDINLRAPMLLTHLAAPYLIATKGNVINFTSVIAVQPLQDVLMYAVSKAALRQFTKCVALDLAPKGVRVNSIVPGAVKTNMVKLLGVTDVEAHNKKRATQLPLKRMVECEEVAELIAFLASDKAKSITGTEHVIDAGHLLGGDIPHYGEK